MSMTTDNASSQNMQAANGAQKVYCTVHAARVCHVTPRYNSCQFQVHSTFGRHSTHVKSRTVNEAVWQSDGDNSTFKVEDKAMTLENDSGLVSRLLRTA